MPLLSPRRLLSTPDGDPNLPNSRIRVRRFAGPSGYVGRLDHVRIAHLTDIHVGRVTPFHVQRQAVALANAERPDLVVITGDFVCHSQIYLDQLTALMREFTAPVLTVLGNHDYWAGAGEVRHALIRGGAEVLSNQHTTVTIRNQPLQVLGLDDAYTGHARREEALRGLRRDVPTLGLSHIAEEADGLWQHDIPLVLAGHTHGGQVTLARLHEIALGRIAGHKYVHGLYGTRTPKGSNAPQGAVYVGAGIGAAIMPLRLGERGKRELTIFELGQSPGTFDEHHAEQPALLGRKPPPWLIQKRNAQVARKREARARKRTREVESK
jgi:predicted MPP superfamily phosphohydrolase